MNVECARQCFIKCRLLVLEHGLAESLDIQKIIRRADRSFTLYFADLVLVQLLCYPGPSVIFDAINTTMELNQGFVDGH